MHRPWGDRWRGGKEHCRWPRRQDFGQNGRHLCWGSRSSCWFCFSYIPLSFQLNSKKTKIKVDCFNLKSTLQLLRAIRCGVDHGSSVHCSQWSAEACLLSCVSEVQSRGVQCLTPAKSTSHGSTFFVPGDWAPAHQGRGRAWTPGFHHRS